MTIGDLRGWLKALPANFDDMNLVFRKYDGLETSEEDKEKDEKENSDYYYALDAPIVSGFIDEESRECCFLDEKSRVFIVDMNAKIEKESNKK